MRMTIVSLAALVIACAAHEGAEAQTPDAEAPMRTAPLEREMIGPVASSETSIALLPSGAEGIRPWLTKKLADRPCESTQTFGLARGRRFPHQGVVLAPDKLVSEETFVAGCSTLGGYATGEFGATFIVSGNGYYGRRGPAEEQWGRFAFSKKKRTPLGTCDLTGFVAYRALNAHRGLEGTDDDYADLGFTTTCPIEFRGWTFAPSFELVKENPIGSNNSLYFWGFAGQIMTPRVLGGRFQFDLANIRSEASTGATPHKYAQYGDAAFVWPIPYGMTLSLGLRYERYAEQDARFGRCIAADAKITLCGRARGKSALPMVNPSIRLERHRTF
jgi:hypothetical protein